MDDLEVPHDLGNLQMFPSPTSCWFTFALGAAIWLCMWRIHLSKGKHWAPAVGLCPRDSARDGNWQSIIAGVVGYERLGLAFTKCHQRPYCKFEIRNWPKFWFHSFSIPSQSGINQWRPPVAPRTPWRLAPWNPPWRMPIWPANSRHGLVLDGWWKDDMMTLGKSSVSKPVVPLFSVASL